MCHKKSLGLNWEVFLLVDASGDDDFQRKLDDAIMSWQKYSVPSAAKMTSFVQWFVTNKSHVICDSMLKPVREECRLGCPFTTNASESIYATLKRKLEKITFIPKRLCLKPSNSPASASLQVSTSSELFLDVSTATTLVNVPVIVLEGIWIK